VLVCASLFALQSQSLAFHTHAVAEYGHGTHHHGPAIHHHDDFGDEMHISAADASSGRVITIAVPSALESSAAIVFADVNEVFAAPVLHAIGDALDVDVRSHSPPDTVKHLLRGPPSSTHL
jgi:hypothetical protein